MQFWDAYFIGVISRRLRESLWCGRTLSAGFSGVLSVKSKKPLVGSLEFERDMQRQGQPRLQALEECRPGGFGAAHCRLFGHAFFWRLSETCLALYIVEPIRQKADFIHERIARLQQDKETCVAP
ncbi:hypothetical protein [Pseudooceanicola sp. LIPI14-2-Ac024]|uniref:hypothetical protein n=1 Tax=Pseudooceanicola sp. LIPI14-2-Ac024 TaxID=3344875 RepID=UPI0035CF1FFE